MSNNHSNPLHYILRIYLCSSFHAFNNPQNCESKHDIDQFPEKKNRKDSLSPTSAKALVCVFLAGFPLAGEWKLVAEERPPVVTLTSRRQISALPAIKVPPYRAIGRNNGVINLESFRGGPNSTSVPRNGGERRGTSRFIGSLFPMGTQHRPYLAAIKQSIYSRCRGRLRLQLIIQPGCPLMKPRKTRGGGLKNSG